MASRICCLLLSASCFGRLCRRPLQTYEAGLLKAKRLLESYTTHTSAEREFFLLYGKKYVAKIPAGYDARAGEVRRLYFDVTAIHLFDCDSEMRI